MEKQTEKCPTCGSIVTVDGDVTKSYVPIHSLISKYQEAYDVIKTRLEEELERSKSERVIFRKMEGCFWVDQNLNQYERDEKTGVFIPTLTAR